MSQPDAALAVHAALAFLRLHGWWEGLERRLPPSWAAAGSALLALIGEQRQGGERGVGRT